MDAVHGHSLIAYTTTGHRRHHDDDDHNQNINDHNYDDGKLQQLHTQVLLKNKKLRTYIVAKIQNSKFLFILDTN